MEDIKLQQTRSSMIQITIRMTYSNCHVLSDFPYSPDEESGKRSRHLGERVNGNTRPSS